MAIKDIVTEHERDAVVADEDAYALLLEIVCGLRSPLLGETEVQAQFKQFLSSLDPADDAWLRRLGQRVLTDAKQIRSHHLQGFGAHSYGQLALRHTARAERLVVVGAGALARDVLAHARDAKTIDVTRLNDGSAIVVVDGNTLQLARDTSNSSVERYGNRLQTLTLYGGSATFETLGRTRYGPCSGGEAYDGGARRSNRAVKQDNTD